MTGRQMVLQVMVEPVPQGSMRSIRTKHGKTVTIHSAGSRLAVYRAAINEAARAKWKGGPSAGPIKIGITFYFLPPKKPRHKVFPITRRVGDIDKLERAVLDALTNVVYIDDSQVVKVEKVKAYFRTPQVLIDVEEID